MRIQPQRIITLASAVVLLLGFTMIPMHPAAAATTAANTTATNKKLAAQVLALWRAKKLVILNYSVNKASDTRDRSLASLQLQDIAAKGYANLSRRCTNMGGRTTVVPDTRVLSFLVAEASSDKYTINTLFGQCHGSGSVHYSGKAVDIACGVNYQRVDVVARRYGMKRNFETCARDSHWHYSVGGA